MASLRRNPRAGITLLEILIAATLLALLSAGILTAMRTGLGALARTNSHLTANRRVIGAQRILREQLANLVPAVAECGSTLDGPGGPRSSFFEGKPEVMRFVTSYSIESASRGGLRIVEMFVIPGVDRKGVRLVVNERPYTGPRSAGALCVTPNEYLPVEPGPGSFVLADQLAFCRFSFQQRLPDAEPQAPWTELWDKPELPRSIRVDMAPLSVDGARLRPTGLTALLRVHRHADLNYVDQ